MSFIAVSSSRTMAGIARIAAQRERARLAQLPAPEPKPAPVAAPEPSNVVPLKTPRDEVRDIIDKVARMHGTNGLAVLTDYRTRKISRARQACICAVKQARPGHSLKQLGNIFGGLDHATVIYSLRIRGFEW